MLLIRCPYCNAERPEAEFTYGGQAHIARPDNPSSLSDDDMLALPRFVDEVEQVRRAWQAALGQVEAALDKEALYRDDARIAAPSAAMGE